MPVHQSIDYRIKCIGHGEAIPGALDARMAVEVERVLEWVLHAAPHTV